MSGEAVFQLVDKLETLSNTSANSPEHRAQLDDLVDLAGRIRSTMAGGGRTTVKAWMEARNGQKVATVQVRATPRGLRDFWRPGYRTVNTARASYVVLDDSAREYKGVKVLAVSDTMLIACAPWGDGVQVLIYEN